MKSKIQVISLMLADIWNTHFPEGLIDEVRKRDNYRCVVCNEESYLHVHHKIPRNLGGIHHKHNLVTLCASCHGVIETGDLERAYQKCLSNYLKKRDFFSSLEPSPCFLHISKRCRNRCSPAASASVLRNSGRYR